MKVNETLLKERLLKVNFGHMNKYEKEKLSQAMNVKIYDDFSPIIERGIKVDERIGE